MAPEQFLRDYEAALATQSWPAIAPFFHEAACVTFSDGTFRGKAEVQRAFERTFALIQDEEYGMTDLHWVMKGEAVAVCLFTFNWSGMIDGRPARGTGRGTSVLVKEAGSWQILTEHLGPAAP